MSGNEQERAPRAACCRRFWLTCDRISTLRAEQSATSNATRATQARASTLPAALLWPVAEATDGGSPKWHSVVHGFMNRVSPLSTRSGQDGMALQVDRWHLSQIGR